MIRLSKEQVTGVGLIAVGDPDFNATPQQRLLATDMESIKYRSPESTERRVMRSGWRSIDDIDATPLPGTRSEINLISKSWQSSHQEPVLALLGMQASEELFKSRAPGHRVIHLATHGYYFRSIDDSLPESSRTSNGAVDYGTNPLLLSGLLLAGANLHGQAMTGNEIDDGFLSALEVSDMNLKGTNLVVLSACETGKGSLQQGEGVYGLRRAFLLAGARTVVCALWQIPDDITSDFMKRLYRRGPDSICDKINAVQRNQLDRLRIKGQPDHPFNWAAFIPIGDWRDF
jgi:CHAT domain-containing protein